MSTLAVTMLSAITSDTLSLSQFAAPSLAAAAVGGALDAVMATRRSAAQAILVDEFRMGERTLDESDLPEVAAVLYRYARAAEEGAARLNLRLLAACFAGQVRERAIAADDFLYYADILAPLRRNEIILLGTLHRLASASGGVKAPPRQLLTSLIAELVPTIFAEGEDFMSTAGALQRTGLVAVSVMPATYGGGGGMVFKSTNLLARLSDFAEIEGVLVRHDQVWR